MQRLFTIFLLSISTVVSAYDDDDEKPIESSRALIEWCKAESQAYFSAKGLQTYNWTASWWDDANSFYVKGSWLVDKEYINVECRIAKGSKQKYAIMNIKNQWIVQHPV